MNTLYVIKFPRSVTFLKCSGSGVNILYVIRLPRALTLPYAPGSYLRQEVPLFNWLVKSKSRHYLVIRFRFRFSLALNL